MTSIANTSGGIEYLDTIEPLWIKLNDWHHVHSPHFSHVFRNRTFANRKTMLNAKLAEGKVRIDLAYPSNSPHLIGYCLSTINLRHIGEVDSIFVEANFRGQGIASRLMQSALNWMDLNHVERKTIQVATGNEAVFRFYEKFGFYPANYILMQTTE